MPQRFKGTVFQFVPKAQHVEFVDKQLISFANFTKPSRLFYRSLSLKREVLLFASVYLPVEKPFSPVPLRLLIHEITKGKPEPAFLPVSAEEQHNSQHMDRCLCRLDSKAASPGMTGDFV